MTRLPDHIDDGRNNFPQELVDGGDRGQRDHRALGLPERLDRLFGYLFELLFLDL